MWLINEEVGREIHLAWKAGAVSPDSQAQFLAFTREREATGGSRILTVADNVAEIQIEGPLSDGPSFMSFLFGGGNTTFGEIRDALAAADADPAVKRAVLSIDSPGGTVAGLFETLDALRAFGKPLNVRATSALSAAFALAAVANGKIEAVTPAAQFGSIGVVTTQFIFDDEVTITSTEAPDKAPDATTEEGLAVIQKRLDDIHGLFVEAIAAGRGTTVKAVNDDFGRGAVMLAREAKANGLIDKLPPKPRRQAGARAEDEPADPSDEPTTPVLLDIQPGDKPIAPAADATQRNPMNLEELKSAHPDIYKTVFESGKASVDVDKAVDAAITKEHDRVGAHLKMGEESGDMKTAIEAIKNGDDMTQTLISTYMTHGMNRADRDERQTETDEAADAASGTSTETPDKDLGDHVADVMDARLNGAAHG